MPHPVLPLRIVLRLALLIVFREVRRAETELRAVRGEVRGDVGIVVRVNDRNDLAFSVR